jgi:hypothetical protein
MIRCETSRPPSVRPRELDAALSSPALACTRLHSQATDSEYAAAVREQLREHVAGCQEWVVGAVRTMRRSLRRELEDNGDLDAVRSLVDAMTPLLQQICDERLWQQREHGCIAAIAQVSSHQLARAQCLLRDGSPRTVCWP